MPVLTVVHHTVSPALADMLDHVLAGTRMDGLESVEVRVRPALTAGAVDALESDAILLGSPVNIGYLSGALKHFLDQVYYPSQQRAPAPAYGYYLHGSSDASGATRAMESIATGMGWRLTRPPVIVTSAPSAPDLDDCEDLGATVAAAAAGLI